MPSSHQPTLVWNNCTGAHVLLLGQIGRLQLKEDVLEHRMSTLFFFLVIALLTFFLSPELGVLFGPALPPISEDRAPSSSSVKLGVTELS